ncbi:hypothetical protein GCM10009827_082670 [Dactylosporangium maewongense]|uniref:SseB protein N-terminal domain-containing protein n=1 Tax=Dactylosporangium maewongense TaxID=634393 RepID=A0ABN2C1K1_9ACTN
MSEWQPATEAEGAMRDALRANDQEQYFRILARTDILLPIAPEGVQSGDSGWGTWTTEGRTHVLAFTSPEALRECLAGHPGTHRRVPFRDLSGIWPNVEWWLAVNPGLPIEGYLPSWFVTQITRGDVRLPGRTLGARARIEQASGPRARATAQVPVRGVPNQPAPTPIERHRMKAAESSSPAPTSAPPGSGPGAAGAGGARSGMPGAGAGAPGAGGSGAGGFAGAGQSGLAGRSPAGPPPKRDVPPPDVAPPGAFLPTRADRPINYERTTGAAGYDRPADFRRPRPPVTPAAAPPPVPPPTGRSGLFDDSDRSSLDVPGERELFGDLQSEAPSRAPGWSPGADTRPAAQSKSSGLPMRPTSPAPGSAGSSGLPTRPGAGEAGSQGFAARAEAGPGGLPMRPTSPAPGSAGSSGLPMRPGAGEAGSQGFAARPGGAEAGPGGLPMRPTSPAPGFAGSSGLPMRPGAEPGASGLPTRPGGESGLPTRPGGGESGLPMRPTSPAGGLPSRPSTALGGGSASAPGRPQSGGLPSRGADAPGQDDREGDPRRYWPRREPARSLGEIFTEHADPVIPAAWQPPPDLPLSTAPPLPTRQPGGRGEADVPAAFRSGEGGSLPSRPTPGGGSLPSRPGAGEGPQPGGPGALPQRPAGQGAPGGLPVRPGLVDPGAFRPGESAPREGGFPQPAPGGFLGGRDRDEEPRPGQGESGPQEQGGFLSAPAGSRAEEPRRPQTEPPLPFDRPVFDRPGFSRLDIEAPEVDEAPAPADEPAAPVDEPSSLFGPVKGRAKAAGFGRVSDLDDHPFFADAEPSGFDMPGRSSGLSDRAPHEQVPWGPDAFEQSNRDQMAQEIAAQQAAREQAAREQAAQEAREQAAREQEAREQEAREQEARDRAAQEAREQEAREQEARERAEREARERAARELAEQEAREQEAREQEAWERAEQERATQEAARELVAQQARDLEAQEAARAQAERDAEAAAAQSTFEPWRPSDEATGLDLAAELRAIEERAAQARAAEEQAARELAEQLRAIEERVARSSAVEDARRRAEEASGRATATSETGSGAAFSHADADDAVGSWTGAQDTPRGGSESTQAIGRPAEDTPISFFAAGAAAGTAAENATGAAPSHEVRSFFESVYEPELVDEPPMRLHAEVVDAEVVTPPATVPVKSAAAQARDFRPANTVEQDLFEAVQANSTDRFLSTLLLAKVLVPEWNGEGLIDPASWRTEHMNGLPHLVVFTSAERMADRLGADPQGSWIKFTRLIRNWPPGDQLAFAVNPDSPTGAVLPGTEVVQLATWAAELGLGVDEPEPVQPAAAASPVQQPRPAFEPPAASGPLLMQKPISPEQLSYYLERGYDRVSGFVHRAGEVAHLQTPEQLYQALGLGYAGSSFKPDAEEAYVLRWKAYRGDLYRIPYGGSHEAGMRAMEGWVIERPPFRGNGFAPSETSDVIAEFKVDSARLPHHAELWRLRRDGRQELIARLDADGPAWRKGQEL